jgi:aspartyl-tRNA(Asn)/glutamyl-tRNA(Gln) amidotransferase subunit A
MKTIHAAAEEIRLDRLSPTDLLEQCLQRIDRREGQVRAWVLVDRERARAEARERTAELERGRWRGPLHGIPLGIKDIIDVFDWPTAAGSKLWKDSIARQDATVVRRLRQAGAVLIGKTVTTAYASFDPPVTANPWGRGRTPGGSSSGSAAAVACGMCLAALGSQTGGSITRPAAFCGVAGMKPTYARVSTHGVLPLAESMDHVGPLARCVRDVAILMQTIAGFDLLSPTMLDQPVPAYEQACIESGRRQRPRLGRVRGLFDSRAEPLTRQLMDDTCTRLAQAGATMVELALPAGFAEVTDRHQMVMAVEAAQFHGPRLLRHPEDYPPRIRSLVEEGMRTSAADYARTKAHQSRLSQAMASLFLDVDALVTPATMGPAPDAGTTGDPVFNSPWSYTGLPVASFPIAFSPDGLPLSLQLVGRHWGEYDLLGAAAWCEQVLAFDPGLPPEQ